MHPEMKTALCEFEKDLREICSEQSDLRPFVCEGNPLDCSVFIVGFNPATSMAFWKFWKKCYGFEKGRWLEEYKMERAAQKKRYEVSNTRRVLGLIETGLGHVSVLETNVYWKPTSKKRKLRREDRDSRGFEFLFRQIQPRVVVAHGKKAQEVLGGAAGKFPTNCTIINEPHFANRRQRPNVEELIRRIKNALDDRPIK